jgi:osmotically-inducible protein OsmY
MNRRIQGFTLACVTILTGTLAACAAFGNCGFGGCPDDAKITADVLAIFKQYSAAKPPNLIYVQTLKSVVYLSGQVDTDTERLTLEAAAHGVAGVTRVVDSINLSYQGW